MKVLKTHDKRLKWLLEIALILLHIIIRCLVVVICMVNIKERGCHFRFMIEMMFCVFCWNEWFDDTLSLITFCTHTTHNGVRVYSLDWIGLGLVWFGLVLLKCRQPTMKNVCQTDFHFHSAHVHCAMLKTIGLYAVCAV